MSQDIPPNNTVYIKNLNEKLKAPALKLALEAAFSQYGQILEIHAKKSSTLRGQAFVVFKDLTSAINAVKGMQGFLFFNKKMIVQFARKDSNTISKQKGTFMTKQKALKNKENKKNTTNVSRMIVDDDSTEEQTNNILFIQNLPEDPSQYCTDLETFVSQFPGFKELRKVPGRTDIAFAEYENSDMANSAKSVMNGFKIGLNHAMQVTYAKL